MGNMGVMFYYNWDKNNRVNTQVSYKYKIKFKKTYEKIPNTYENRQNTVLLKFKKLALFSNKDSYAS